MTKTEINELGLNYEDYIVAKHQYINHELSRKEYNTPDAIKVRDISFIHIGIFYDEIVRQKRYLAEPTEPFEMSFGWNKDPDGDGWLPPLEI